MKSLLIILFAVVVANACGNRVESNTQLADTLPLPVVPDTLVLPVLRADFVAQHYWDGMAQVRSEMWHDTLFIEQNFADFASVLPYTSSERAIGIAAQAYVSTFINDSLALSLAMYVAENYLMDRESTVYNEQAYIPFAQAYIDADGMPESECLRQAYLMRVARANAPGTLIADAEYEGTTLRRLLSADRPTLVMFYDPDCDDCHALRQRMQADAALLQSVYILEVNVNKLPEEGFFFNATPTLYLVDTDATVLLKDCRYEQLLSLLQT